MENNIEVIKVRLKTAFPGDWLVNENNEIIVKNEGRLGKMIRGQDADFVANAKSDIKYLIEKCERYEKALNKIVSEKTMSHYTTSAHMDIDFREIAKAALLNE